MSCFTCKSGDRVLLVGEGNFSFSVDFINFNNELIDASPAEIEIISTCFETDDKIHQTILENVKILHRKGLRVLFSVDATALKEHPFIGGMLFSKIIFNFPHVGGKMKIHLNRQLLKNFFSSARHVLADGGIILVTLCDGQGGTGADKTQRRWDDTWKIVEMAAESDFVLNSVYPFSIGNFPKYKSIGYRSLQKGFNINDSLVHVFKSCSPPSISLCDVSYIETLISPEEVTTPFGKLILTPVYTKKLRQNPLEKETSPQCYLFQTIVALFRDLKIIHDVFIYGFHCEHENIVSLLNRVHESDKYKICTEHAEYAFGSLKLNKVDGDFSQQPVSCMSHIVGKDCSKTVVLFIGGLLKKLSNSEYNEVERDEKFLLDMLIRMKLIQLEEIHRKDVKLEVCSIFLDDLAAFLFRPVNWKELWARETCIGNTSNGPVLLKSSLYPCSYTFDLTLSASPEYSEENFYNIIWHIAGDYISKIELVSIYKPDNIKTNYSYRITYISYAKPLHRKRVIDIQENIIGKSLERILNVKVI